MMGDRERCLQAEMDEYLSKPLQQSHLIQTILKCATLGGQLLEKNRELENLDHKRSGPGRNAASPSQYGDQRDRVRALGRRGQNSHSSYKMSQDDYEGMPMDLDNKTVSTIDRKPARPSLSTRAQTIGDDTVAQDPALMADEVEDPMIGHRARSSLSEPNIHQVN